MLSRDEMRSLNTGADWLTKLQTGQGKEGLKRDKLNACGSAGQTTWMDAHSWPSLYVIKRGS